MAFSRNIIVNITLIEHVHSFINLAIISLMNMMKIEDLWDFIFSLFGAFTQRLLHF